MLFLTLAEKIFESLNHREHPSFRLIPGGGCAAQRFALHLRAAGRDSASITASASSVDNTILAAESRPSECKRVLARY